MPHDEGLSSLRKHLDLRTEKSISTDTLVELREIVLKNNIFNFNLKTYRRKKGTAIGTKFAPSYSMLFISDPEERILQNFDLKPYVL